MFIRKTTSRQSTCFQLGEKRAGRFVVKKHIGCASRPEEIEALRLKAQTMLHTARFGNQGILFPVPDPLRAKRVTWKITGYHHVFGTVYDRIGFPPTMLRDLVVTRIVHPSSKVAAVRYLTREMGIDYEKNQVFRFLDTLSKTDLTRIAYAFVSARHPTGITICFYDVTTLYFETTAEDALRSKGFSKNHRTDVPQILLGLFVDEDGYPFDFSFYEGKTFEGHTLPKAIAAIRKKYAFPSLTVVADAGMLSEGNLTYLEQEHLHYIVGARLKHLPAILTRTVLSHAFSKEPVFQVAAASRRLIVDYCAKRAVLDARTRSRAVDKLKERMKKGIPVVKKSKYLAVSGIQAITGINEEKVREDARFDGLKGYLTNADNPLSSQDVIARYHELWQVEKAFRMSKHDLRERPVFHRRQRRIEAHLILCFVSLLVLRETERKLKTINVSLEQAIERLGTVGEGIVRVGSIELPMDSELDPKTQRIHKLFEGH